MDYIASSMNNSGFKDLHFLEKMQKCIRKLPKHFANWKLWTAHSNPVEVFIDGVTNKYSICEGLNSFFSS